MTINKLDSNKPIPSSIAAYNKYGIAPSQVRYIVNNLFYFPPRYNDLLIKLFINIINSNDFFNALHNGIIVNKEIAYQVIFYKTDPIKIRRRQKYTKVALSFRKVDSIFNIMPTVLVKEYNTNINTKEKT